MASPCAVFDHLPSPFLKKNRVPAAVIRTIMNGGIVHAEEKERERDRGGWNCSSFCQQDVSRIREFPIRVSDRRRRTLSRGTVTCSPFLTNISAPSGNVEVKLSRITRDIAAFLFLLSFSFFFCLLGIRIHFPAARARDFAENQHSARLVPRKIDRYEPDMGNVSYGNDQGRRRICHNVVLRRGVGKFSRDK